MEKTMPDTSTSNILKEVLKMPFIKTILKNNLRAIEHKDGQNFIKTLLWQDPEVILGVLGGLPGTINPITGAIAEMLEQVRAKFSPGLLKGFSMSILDEINTAPLGQGLRTIAGLVKDIADESPEIREVVLDKGPIAIANGINVATKKINEIGEDNPDLIGNFISGITSNLDKKDLSGATTLIADAFLDQGILPLVPWTARLVTGRIKKRLARFMPT